MLPSFRFNSFKTYELKNLKEYLSGTEFEEEITYELNNRLFNEAWLDLWAKGGKLNDL